MRQVVYEKNDGTKGSKYIFEDGDEVVAKFDTPRESKLGKFNNYSLGVEPAEIEVNVVEEIRTEKGKRNDYKEIGKDKATPEFIQITEGQYKKFKDLGNLRGKTVKAYKYENDYGNQIGVEVKQ